MPSKQQSTRLAEGNPTSFYLVENRTDLQLVGSIEVEFLSDTEQCMVFKVEFEPPIETIEKRIGDVMTEETHERLNETSEEHEGVEVPVGFWERLSFAVMEGCTSCHCAPFESSMRTSENNRVSSNRRSVGFGCLEIHEFYMTLGDHPSAASGPPVSLDYSQEEITKTISLDEYERDREPRRKRKELKLSYKERRKILETERGFSTDEVNQAWIEALKIRQQRQETLKRSPVMNFWDEVAESTQRKMNRLAEAMGLLW